MSRRPNRRLPGRRPSSGRRADRGSILPLVPIVLLAVLVVGGLVVDGLRDLNDRSNAQSYAEEAARAGAEGVDLTDPKAAIDQNLARIKVTQYCADVAHQLGAEYVSCGLDLSKGGGTGFTDAPGCGGVVEPVVVNTTVTLHFPTTLMGLIGVSELTVTGAASAQPFQGQQAAGAC